MHEELGSVTLKGIATFSSSSSAPQSKLRLVVLSRSVMLAAACVEKGKEALNLGV